MEWVKIAEQIGLGGVAVIGLIIIVRELINKSKNKVNENYAVLLRILLEKQNHISDNLKEVSEKLEKLADKEDKIITRLEVLSTKVNGYARDRS